MALLGTLLVPASLFAAVQSQTHSWITLDGYASTAPIAADGTPGETHHGDVTVEKNIWNHLFTQADCPPDSNIVNPQGVTMQTVTFGPEMKFNFDRVTGLMRYIQRYQGARKAALGTFIGYQMVNFLEDGPDADAFYAARLMKIPAYVTTTHKISGQMKVSEDDPNTPANEELWAAVIYDDFNTADILLDDVNGAEELVKICKYTNVPLPTGPTPTDPPPTDPLPPNTI